MSADMAPYCLAHDDWLIMKLCMYVGYHDANIVSNFGGDPVTQLHFKKFYQFIYAVLVLLRARRTEPGPITKNHLNYNYNYFEIST